MERSFEMQVGPVGLAGNESNAHWETASHFKERTIKAALNRFQQWDSRKVNVRLLERTSKTGKANGLFCRSPEGYTIRATSVQ